jgi:hypothetical protein
MAKLLECVEIAVFWLLMGGSAAVALLFLLRAG